jgi:hypothetical protein
MTMRINRLVTHLRPADAYTLIEFLDQLREVLMDTYGDEIIAMLQEASLQVAPQPEPADDDVEF